MKKNIIIILIASVLFSLTFTVYVYAEEREVTINGITYEVTNGYCVVKKCDSDKGGYAIIPDYVEFNNKKLNVKKIEAKAFNNCASIIDISIPNGVTEIGDYAFFNCYSINNITIPNTVTVLGDFAFSGCQKLSSVVLSENITRIGDYTFNDCNSLRNLILPNNIISIGNSAFRNCACLTYIEIPKSVKEIGSGAFAQCRDLKSINIPSEIKLINDGTFYECSNLESVLIPDSVTEVGISAFEGCFFLKNVYFSGNTDKWLNIYFKKDNNSLFDARIICNDSKLKADDILYLDGIKYVYDENGWIVNSVCLMLSGDIVIPSVIKLFDCIKLPVISIGDDAFNGYWYDCENITSITIGDNIKEIGRYAFSRCTNLNNIVIGKSVSSIGTGAFQYCKSLKRVIIPDNVTKTGGDLFYSCCNLISVTMPENINFINNGTFENCDNLQTVYFKGSEEQWHKITKSIYNDSLNNVEIIFNHTDAEFEKGDCNKDGAVDNKDVVVIFRYVSNNDQLDDESVYDLNNDNVVDNKDVVSLFRFVSVKKN